MKRICVFASNGLGDGLLSLVLARNLERLGHTVTIYSTPLLPLASWVPWAEVRPFPTEPNMDAELVTFDHVIAAEYSRAVGKGDVVYLSRQLTVVQAFEEYLKKNWGSVESIKPADLAIPPHYLPRKEIKRVVIHPTSGADKKTWPAEKYIELGHRLLQNGYKPVFIMSPTEAAHWTGHREIPLTVFPNLTETAGFLYESGYFIGNDSGLGHMASLFRVPTLSLFARHSSARIWRPGWGPGMVVTPTLKLPGSRLKEKYWKSLLTVGKVMRKFQHLVRIDA